MHWSNEDYIDLVVPAVSDVKLQAAMPNPKGTDRGQEWVSVKNTSSAAVDLKAHALADDSGHVQRLSGTLAAGATEDITIERASKIHLVNKGGAIHLQRDGVRVDSAHGGRWARVSPWSSTNG